MQRVPLAFLAAAMLVPAGGAQVVGPVSFVGPGPVYLPMFVTCQVDECVHEAYVGIIGPDEEHDLGGDGCWHSVTPLRLRLTALQGPDDAISLRAMDSSSYPAQIREAVADGPLGQAELRVVQANAECWDIWVRGVSVTGRAAYVLEFEYLFS